MTRARRQQLEARLWAEKEQRARSLEDKAALEYDRVRKHIRKVRDAGERDAHWRALEEALAGFSKRFGGDGR